MKKRILSLIMSVSLVIGTISASAVSIEFENIEKESYIDEDILINYESIDSEENTVESSIEQDSISSLATGIEEMVIESNLIESKSYIQNYALNSVIKDMSGRVISNDLYNQYLINIANTIESPDWTYEKNGKILHNLPVTDWTRSSNCVSFTRRDSASRLALWNWSAVQSLNKAYNKPEQVWDLSRNVNHYDSHLINVGTVSSYNDILYDGTTWVAPNGIYTGTTVIEDLYKYEGTFKIDKTYDMSNLYFTLSTVASDRIIYLNDNIYVFIYPTCLKQYISNNTSSPYYFMNFLCFWTGTIATVTDIKTFYGIPAQTAYTDLSRFSDLKPYESAINFVGWNFDATTNNIGNTISNSYLLAKNNPNYDGEYIITVIASDIAGYGGMYRPIISMEYKDSVITYLGNGNTGGNTEKQTKVYGEDLYITKNGYVKEGYSFVNWNTKADGSGKTYNPNDAFKREDGLTLYAQWQINQYPVTYIDKDTNGNEIGRTTVMLNYNTPVSGSDIGSSDADNAYHNQYRYVSDTSATVTTDGATVYRIFEFCETEKESHLTWNDNNDADKLRPKKYTLKLKQNGVIIDEVELPTDTTDYVFAHLPKYDKNGNPYKYELETVVSERYQVEYGEDGSLIFQDYQPANFSVIIPKQIVLDGNTGKASYTVSVDGTFYYNDTLTIKPDTSFILTDRSNISQMTASVLLSKNQFKKENVNSVVNGTVSTDKKQFAGIWNGRFHFDIKFVMSN